MKILICGDRNWFSQETIRHQLLRYDATQDIVIHGDASGADKLGAKAAELLGFTPDRVLAFPADWTKYGRAAGPIRNQQMIDQKPDVVLAFHDQIDKSKGTKNLILLAQQAGIKEIYLFTLNGERSL